MTNICVPTIMHSGSRVLRYQILKAHEKNGDEDDCLFNGNSGRKMIDFHTTETDRFTNEIANYPIFTSLRHPRRIMASFDLRASYKTTPRYPYDETTYNQMFRALIDDIAPRDPIYLHVDHPVRDKEVEVIREATGLPIEADWSVKDGHTDKLAIGDCPPVLQEYIDFYYGTMP